MPRRQRSVDRLAPVVSTVGPTVAVNPVETMRGPGFVWLDRDRNLPANIVDISHGLVYSTVFIDRRWLANGEIRCFDKSIGYGFAYGNRGGYIVYDSRLTNLRNANRLPCHSMSVRKISIRIPKRQFFFNGESGACATPVDVETIVSQMLVTFNVGLFTMEWPMIAERAHLRQPLVGLTQETFIPVNTPIADTVCSWEQEVDVASSPIVIRENDLFDVKLGWSSNNVHPFAGLSCNIGVYFILRGDIGRNVQ